MTCPKCGANNIDGFSFCVSCGANLNEPTQEQYNNVAQTNYNNVQQVQPTQEQYYNVAQTNYNNAQQVQPTQEQYNNVAQTNYNNVQQVQPQYNYQQPVENVSYNYDNNNSNNKKSGKKFIIIAIVAILIALGAFAFLFMRKSKKAGKDFDITDAPAFFIKERTSNKYALFYDDGKKLTDFIFTDKSSFINGTAVVEKDNEYGIINTKGKMTVDFGKYAKIYNSAGLYEARDAAGKYYLINSKGKVLYELENIEVITYSGNNYYSILEDEDKQNYTVLNFEGKKMLSFEKTGSDRPVTSYKDEYFTVNYNNKTYMMNALTGKTITSFDSDVEYCVNSVSEDESVIVIGSCGSTKAYKYIKNGKLYDVNASCDDKFYYLDSTKKFECRSSNGKYLVDSNNNLSSDMSNRQYFSVDTYAETPKNTQKVVFYEKGKEIKSLDCKKISPAGTSVADFYIINSISGSSCGNNVSGYEYYKSNGEKAFDVTFEKAENFDELGNARVKEKNSKEYLIDKNGKKISNEYSMITGAQFEYYIVSINRPRGLIDKTGKEVLPLEYNSITVYEYNDKYYALLETQDYKYIVYDLQQKSEIFSSNNEPTFTKNYISVAENGNIKYYTYSGNMFYEDKR